jgi:hypothetical protein
MGRSHEKDITWQVEASRVARAPDVEEPEHRCMLYSLKSFVEEEEISI